MNRAVFLDRDNTIIHNDEDLGDPDGARLIQGVASAIASLRGLGYKIIVITNQGGVARGRYEEADVTRVHERIAELLARGANGATVDRFYYCPFHPRGTVAEYCSEHPNRKPSPGMLLEAAEDFNLDLTHCWMVGDQRRDVQAGRAAGTRTILLRSDAVGGDEGGNGGAETEAREDAEQEDDAQRAPRRMEAEETGADYVVRNVVEAVRVIAQARKPDSTGPVNQTYVKGKRWDAAAVAELQKAAGRQVNQRETPHREEDEEASAESVQPDDSDAEEPEKGAATQPQPEDDDADPAPASSDRAQEAATGVETERVNDTDTAAESGNTNPPPTPPRPHITPPKPPNRSRRPFHPWNTPEPQPPPPPTSSSAASQTQDNDVLPPVDEPASPAKPREETSPPPHEPTTPFDKPSASASGVMSEEDEGHVGEGQPRGLESTTKQQATTGHEASFRDAVSAPTAVSENAAAGPFETDAVTDEVANPALFSHHAEPDDHEAVEFAPRQDSDDEAVRSVAASPPVASVASSERESASASASHELSGEEPTLRLILQELRSQRGRTDAFSSMHVVAMVLQMIAAVCLLGGLWMGAGDTGLFQRWLGAGLLFQLATIAALLFNRPGA